MLAAVLHAPGPPSAFKLEDVPIPAIGDDDVLVKVAACGVSYRDVVERNGTYRRDVTFPLIIGLEISGVVQKIGSAVRRLRPGDRVCSKAFSSCGYCRYCRTGRESTCRNRKPVRGGYAEYVCLPQDAFVLVPEELALETACSLGPGAGVAINAVRDVARVTIGETVLITGASGGVGLPSLQLAKMAGARVIAVTRGANKRSFLREAGADEIVVFNDGSFVEAVRELTADEGVDVVIDTVGSHVFEMAFDSLALHGRYAVVGQLSGDSVAINLARIFFKRAQLLGVGSVSRVQLEDAVRLTCAGALRPRTARVMSLREIAEAHQLVEDGALMGRVIVKP
jgi:NADPH:quinone reductase-like Zn-dependent oxidoreductase